MIKSVNYKCNIESNNPQICPAALYVDVYRILEDGTECKAL